MSNDPTVLEAVAAAVERVVYYRGEWLRLIREAEQEEFDREAEEEAEYFARESRA